MKYIIFFTLICLITRAFASSDEVPVRYLYPLTSYVKGEDIGVVVKSFKSDEINYFKFTKKVLATAPMSEKEFKNYFNIATDDYKNIKIIPEYKKREMKYSSGVKISYEYLSCSGENLEHDPYHRMCNELSLKIDDKAYLVKSKFYFNQYLADPQFYGDYIVFRGVWPPSIGTDSGKPIGESVDGVVAIDLKKLEEIKKLNITGITSPFFGPTTTHVKSDDNGYFWIGNNYGFFGLDKNMDEKVSCYFMKGKTTPLKMKCMDADYVLDSKGDQLFLLEKKALAISQGKDPPEDETRFTRAYLVCTDKISEKLRDAFYDDKSDKKYFDKKYSSIVECMENGSKRKREYLEKVRSRNKK